MTGPKVNSDFCFSVTLIEVEGKQNSLFPVGPVIKCFVMPLNSKLEKNCEAMVCFTPAGSQRFQGAQSDNVRVKSSCCCFPCELMSFVRPRELVSLTYGMRDIFLQSENLFGFGGITM